MRRVYRQFVCNLLRVSGRHVELSSYSRGPLNSAVVLMPELFGDTIVTTPLLQALRLMAPAAEITVVGTGSGVQLLVHDERLSRVIDLRLASREERRDLFGRRFDVLFSTKDHPSFTNLRLVRRIDAGYRVGFDHPGHQGFFNGLVARPEQMPVWEKTVGLVEPLGAVPIVTPYMPDGPVSPAIREFVATRMAGTPVLAVSISASKPEKRWPVSRWRELLAGVTGPIVVLAAPEHASDRRQLESELHAAIPSPATESLFDVGHIVRGASVLLTTDTAAVHVASCFDTPVLALYRNPRDLAKFPPLSRSNKVLLALNDDLTSISVAEVREGLDSLKRELA